MIHGTIGVQVIEAEELKVGDRIAVGGKSMHIEAVRTNSHGDCVLDLTIDDAKIKKYSTAMLIVPKNLPVARHLEV